MTEGLVASRLVVRRGARRVLDGVDFTAAPARITCILGPNGAGKSTLLKALAGVLPFEGEVTLDGTSLACLTAKERARRVAYVPQVSSLSAALTVETVVAQGRYAHSSGLGRPGDADLAAVRSAMERTDVHGLAHRDFDRLSTGERRRVLLARALATEARVILLDEPTAALDVRHALELLTLLAALREEGYAIVVVLHELDSARRHTDRATLLDGGRVVREGASALAIDPPTVRQVFGVTLVEQAALGFRLPGEGES